MRLDFLSFVNFYSGNGFRFFLLMVSKLYCKYVFFFLGFCFQFVAVWRFAVIS